MQNIILIIIVVLLGVGGYYWLTNQPDTPAESDSSQMTDEANDNQLGENSEGDVAAGAPIISPVSHASFVLEWGGVVVYNDPVGDSAQFAEFAAPDIILVSDIHGDHLSAETLTALTSDDTALIAPQAVVDELPAALAERTIVMNNADTRTVAGISIEAIPMYNLPMKGPDYRHVKGRGNGYLLEMNNERIYIAGDTEDIKEMRALTDIDIAFIPMNLPYTMGVEAAADGVVAFAPDVVYPYHYRGPDGLSDVEQFQELVNADNPDIEVRLDTDAWYPSE